VRLSTRMFALACSVAVASPVGAQHTTNTTNDAYVTDMVTALTDASRWSLSGNLATNRYGTFLMQNVEGGERALRGDNHFGWGLGAGFDITDKLGLRLGWTYTNTNMQFKDYSGGGSDFLDSDDLGKLKSNIAALDVVHYFVGSRSLIAPYAGAGVAGVWSSLGPDGPALITPGGSQQFHMGINANVGVQVRVIPQLFGRVEWNTMGTRNPFNGNRSYKATNGITFDEPSRINKTEWRFAAAYYFAEPDKKQPAVTAAKTK
jgi:opacity protein-like surface antigen